MIHNICHFFRILQTMEEKFFDGYGRFNYYRASFAYNFNSKLNRIDKRSSFENKCLNR